MFNVWSGESQLCNDGARLHQWRMEGKECLFGFSGSLVLAALWC